ncbi:MAG TPA: uroporphyrinogen-III synthase, partial [Ferruginibacter sp.]|nr:uroporphyrinogen-III synthase [Ferruginibacter sp.]
MYEDMPRWRIYCIGNATAELVKQAFGDHSIAGTADTAAELAEFIVAEGEIKEVIFFCGDQRRNELPSRLIENDIGVNEIVVYHTIEVPNKIHKEYKGILFFSPSAVKSFFSVNRIHGDVVLFAIGTTTAESIKNYADNKIIMAAKPTKENLFEKLMEYFT